MVLRKFTSADPTPLVETPLAFHVVAATRGLFYTAATFRTVGNCSVFLGPLDEFFVGGLVTGTTLVPKLPTQEADLDPTLARRGFLAAATGRDVVEAVGAGAPLEFGIQIHIDVFFELKVLRENRFRGKSLDIVAIEVAVTSGLHAGDLQDLSIGY